MDKITERLSVNKGMSALVLWHFRIAGVILLFQLIFSSNFMSALSSPSWNVNGATVLFRAAKGSAPLFIFCFMAGMCVFLFWAERSRLLRFSMIALSILAVLGSIAALVDPIHGALPIRNDLLFRFAIFPLAQRADLMQTVGLATAFLYLGLYLLQNRTSRNLWGWFLILSAVWQLGAGRAQMSLESQLFLMDSMAAASKLASIGIVFKIQKLLLAGFLLGVLGLTWKGEPEPKPLAQPDGSIQLGGAILLMFLGAWQSSYISLGPSFLLLLRSGMAGAIYLVMLLVGLALPIAALFLLRKRDRCLKDLGYSKWRVGGVLLQAIAIFLIVRPAIPLIFGKPASCPSPGYSILFTICGPP